MLTIRGELPLPHNVYPQCGCSDSNNLYVGCSDSVFRSIGWVNMGTNNSYTLSAQPYGVCLISPATACIVYSGQNKVDYLCTSSFAHTSVTVNNSSVYTTNSTQQIAGNMSSGLAMSVTGSSTDKLFLHNSSNQSSTGITPSGYSGHYSTCIIYKSDSNNWLVGWDNGNVTEVDNSCLLYTSPSPRDPKTSRMPSSA